MGAYGNVSWWLMRKPTRSSRVRQGVFNRSDTQQLAARAVFLSKRGDCNICSDIGFGRLGLIGLRTATATSPATLASMGSGHDLLAATRDRLGYWLRATSGFRLWVGTLRTGRDGEPNRTAHLASGLEGATLPTVSNHQGD